MPELYAAIGAELDLNFDHVASPIIELNQFLLKIFRSGGTAALIFDEAQRLSIETLEEIRLLSNLETPTTKLLQVILAGQPELDTLLDSVGLRALRQRVVLRHSLAPLGHEDTIHYIANRIRVAGAKRSPFTLGACRSVYSFSGGVPRLINLICGNAMLSGYAADSPLVDRRRVEMIAREMRLETRRQATVPSRKIADEGYSRIAWRVDCRSRGRRDLSLPPLFGERRGCSIFIAEPGAHQLGAFVGKSIATTSCSRSAFSSRLDAP